MIEDNRIRKPVRLKRSIDGCVNAVADESEMRRSEVIEAILRAFWSTDTKVNVSLTTAILEGRTFEAASQLRTNNPSFVRKLFEQARLRGLNTREEPPEAEAPPATRQRAAPRDHVDESLDQLEKQQRKKQQEQERLRALVELRKRQAAERRPPTIEEFCEQLIEEERAWWRDQRKLDLLTEMYQLKEQYGLRPRRNNPSDTVLEGLKKVRDAVEEWAHNSEIEELRGRFQTEIRQLQREMRERGYS